MKTLKSVVKVGEKQVPVNSEQFGTLDEAVKQEGYTKTLSLINYAFALFQRAKKLSEIVAMDRWEKGRPKVKA